MNNQKSLIREIIKLQTKFSDNELSIGLGYFENRNFKAKDIILSQGKVCDYLFFAENSISRCYYFDKEGEEKTIWMEPEKMFITDFESFVTGYPSNYYLQFYQNTETWLISRKNLLFLYENYKDWSVFGIRLMENYHVRILYLFTKMFRNNATENYELIEQRFSKFLKIAPLKDVASMLNLSAVSLSRIRAGTQTKK